MYPRYPQESPPDADELDRIYRRGIPIGYAESSHPITDHRYVEDYIRDVYDRLPLPPNHNTTINNNINNYPTIKPNALDHPYANAPANYHAHPQPSTDDCPCGRNNVVVAGYKWCKICRRENPECECGATRGLNLRYVDGCGECRGRYKVGIDLWGPPMFPGGRYESDWEEFIKDQRAYEGANAISTRQAIGAGTLDQQAGLSNAAKKGMEKGKGREARAAESETDDDMCSDCTRACKTPASADDGTSYFEDCERMETERQTYEEAFRACIEDLQAAEISAAAIEIFEQKIAQHDYPKSIIATHNEAGKDLARRQTIEEAFGLRRIAAVSEAAEEHAARGAYESLRPAHKEVSEQVEVNQAYVDTAEVFKKKPGGREIIEKALIEERVQAEIENVLRNLREVFRRNELKQQQSTIESSIAGIKAGEESGKDNGEGLDPGSFQYQHDHSCC